MEVIADSVVNETENITLSCRFSGLPPTQVNWSRFDNTDLMNDKKFSISQSNITLPEGGAETTLCLSITSVDGSDTGSYTCTAYNFAHGPSEAPDVNATTFNLLVQSKSLNEITIAYPTIVGYTVVQCVTSQCLNKKEAPNKVM